jgi:hypothetical protein
MHEYKAWVNTARELINEAESALEVDEEAPIDLSALKARFGSH